MPRAALRLGAVTVAAGAYGFAVGSAHSWTYATRNVAKLPILLVGTGLLCAVAYYVTARFLGAPLSFRRVQGLVLDLFGDASVLLASLALPVLFFGRVLVRMDDGRVGEYGLFLGWNVGLIAVSASLALVRQAHELLGETDLGRARCAAVTGSWLVLSLLVGGQIAFLLRPFFGLPASRGGSPPFALWNEPDVRGATNFYEAMLQILQDPGLPAAWGY